MLRRGVLRAVSLAVGNPGDPNQAKAAFSTAVVQVPRATFLFEAAQLLYKESDLFGPKRMERPNRRMLLCSEALLAIRSIPETDETKQLAVQIQGTVKAIGGA